MVLRSTGIQNVRSNNVVSAEHSYSDVFCVTLQVRSAVHAFYARAS